jgi:pilus assembly protein CpaB
MSKNNKFGGVSSQAQAYATKVRWVVGCLAAVIVVLIVAVVMIAQKTDATQNAPVTAAPAAQQPVSTGVIDVLVASARIEEGTQLTADLFAPLAMEPDKTPMAVIRAKDLELIIGKYSSRLINANMPIVLDDISDNPPLTAISIPPGYRAVSISVDNRTSVEGFAKPNSRVDVLWTYNQNTENKVATIARFVKVLSVGGYTNVMGQRAAVDRAGTTVTLLVTERDAKKIELARSNGSISLSLVGESETNVSSGEPDSVTIADLVGKPASTQPTEVANDGVMYTSDPRSGRQLRYVLRNGRWALDRSFAGAE